MRINDKIMSFEDKINFLKTFSVFDYNEMKDNCTFEYCLHDDALSIFKEKYNFNKIVDNIDEFRDMVKLMIWVNEKLVGDGNCIPPKEFDADYIIQNSKKGLRSNCYMYAVVLNEVFLSMGFLSRMVRCMPIDIDFNDCHCVTEVYSNKYKKWVVFDAANRAYYLNEKMMPLNLFEMRESIINNKRIFVPLMSKTNMHRLVLYFSKNLIRFESCKCSKYGNEKNWDNVTIIHFQPKNYPVADKRIYYEEQNIYINHIHTSNPNIFWAVPDKIV